MSTSCGTGFTFFDGLKCQMYGTMLHYMVVSLSVLLLLFGQQLGYMTNNLEISLFVALFLFCTSNNIYPMRHTTSIEHRSAVKALIVSMPSSPVIHLVPYVRKEQSGLRTLGLRRCFNVDVASALILYIAAYATLFQRCMPIAMTPTCIVDSTYIHL